MQSRASLALTGSLVVLLAGCAGQTTDPRQGGLFSYNPQAYEQRLQERQSHLSQVEQENRAAEDQALSLESERAAREQENVSLRAKIKKLSASVSRLEKDIKAKQAKNAAQKKEQQRLLTEAGGLQSASRATDNIADPEEKRLELQRLQEHRDKLEKEAANLMKL